VGDVKEELVGVHLRDASKKSDEGDKARTEEAGVGMARDKGVIAKDDVGETGVVAVSDGDGGGDDRV
jgi:predicted neutral ceramidase superfamily lipid hydrolase